MTKLVATVLTPVLAAALALTGALSASSQAAPTNLAPTSLAPTTAAPAAAKGGFGAGVDVASWNVLGHDHTAPGGNKRGYASGTKRITWAVDRLERQGYDIVGLQEIEPPQQRAFKSYAGKRWSMHVAGLNAAVAWRTADFRLIQARQVVMPYFRGQAKQLPYVLLEQRSTGQRLWVASFHNPADARGPAQKHRNEAAKRQVALANRLGSGGVPVVFAGDFNESWSYVCKLHRGTAVRSFVGGGMRNGRCVTEKRRWNRVDWVLGSRVAFSRASTLKDAQTRRVTDHPLVGARITSRG